MFKSRWLYALFAAWLIAMLAALWSFEHESLIFDIFCIAPKS